MKYATNQNPQVLVCQRGARRRYAVPRLFEEAGILAALYTNSCAYSRLGRIATKLHRLGVRASSVKALSSRIPKGIPLNKIFSSDRELGSLLSKLNLGSSYKRWGLQGACIVYSMYGEEFDFLKWANAQGSKIIIDVFVHPETNRIVSEEESYIHGSASMGSIRSEDNHSKRAFELADILLCPSEWVADGVRDFAPEHAHKIRIVPYGSSVTVAETINTPEPNQVLFAGRDPLRKGLHYLAEAAYLLRKDGLSIDVRVAGVSSDEIDWIEHREELNCLGKIPMEQMKEEYAKASVFVLPSLSEGQAGVLLEAMACGCAVVATKESGVDFEQGCGVMVPAKDALALAEEIKKVITDDRYRESLAQGALRQAGSFSMEAWKKRLINSVERLCNA